MFSAVYMVCAVELGGCGFFVDSMPYKTLEECNSKAVEVMAANQERTAKGELFEHMATHQCISWEQA